jgi:hypothetical protein
MRVLDLLTSKPSGICNLAAADASFTEACVSHYSARTDTMQSNLRIWIRAPPMCSMLTEKTRRWLRSRVASIPLYRYWGVLSDDKSQAALDIDGFAYPGENVLHPPSFCAAAGGRKLNELVASSPGAILS